jgi:GNAT superfamily N-acetyltransferase
MSISVELYEDAGKALEKARAFLASEPVLHNVILSLLETRAAYPEPGRYWVASDGERVAGVVFQSPLDFTATITPMSRDAVAAMVDGISEAGVALPGVSGEAGTAARFAGQWTERHKSAAVPIEGQRIYEIREVQETPAVAGRMRRAERADRELVIAWMRGFQADTGDGGGRAQGGSEQGRSAASAAVHRRSFWLWDDGGPVSMAMRTEPVEGVVRVGAVYTPPELRNRGYAGACVGALSQQILEGGHRSILYTDLGNPVSNSIYRRLGYRAVAEVLRYRFA